MSEMYFAAQPESAYVPFEFQLEYAGKPLRFHSASGVFSKSEADTGSLALLDACRKVFGPIGHGPQGDVLDLGCGIGLIGIVFKRIYPDFKLVLADCNQRALALAKENCRTNGIGYTEIVETDAWSAFEGRAFDLVLTNPPIRAGKFVVYDFFRGAAEHLRPGGRLICVVNKHQGADSARKELKRLFDHCETVHRDKGFHVFCCVRMDELG